MNYNKKVSSGAVERVRFWDGESQAGQRCSSQPRSLPAPGASRFILFLDNGEPRRRLPTFKHRSHHLSQNSRHLGRRLRVRLGSFVLPRSASERPFVMSPATSYNELCHGSCSEQEARRGEVASFAPGSINAEKTDLMGT